MDWFAPAGSPPAPSADGGWASSGDELESFEQQQSVAVLSTLRSVEEELLRVSASLDVHAAASAASSPPPAAAVDDSPEAAVQRWYALQARAARPPFEEWAGKFPFLRVEGRGLGLPPAGAGGGGGEAEREAEREEVLAEHCEVCREGDPARRALEEAVLEDLGRVLGEERELLRRGKADEARGGGGVMRYVAGARSG
ncbi:hypothetical protein TeGR_g12752 [Tetraparma gracilis]|uniref:Uncharacterized protein n=1 Tax=Tetraparma gracilis TaxID=2962635 RepID=A0ABQ6NAF4_9STRA|nr:hypothetical protein TeGR_g12752 [Tetraparma gracilis]